MAWFWILTRPTSMVHRKSFLAVALGAWMVIVHSRKHVLPGRFLSFFLFLFSKKKCVCVCVCVRVCCLDGGFCLNWQPMTLSFQMCQVRRGWGSCSIWWLRLLLGQGPPYSDINPLHSSYKMLLKKKLLFCTAETVQPRTWHMLCKSSTLSYTTSPWLSV